MFRLNAGYFQLQMASERDRESAYKLVGKYLRDDAKGVPQMAYIGCIVTQSPRAESAQEVCDQLVAGAKYIDKQRWLDGRLRFLPLRRLTRSQTTAVRTMRATSHSKR